MREEKKAAPAAVAGPSEDVRKKIETNTWDHFGDILPTLKAISRGEWYWGANSRCKYIEIRLDTRDGGCILYDRDRVRISPAQFAFQAGGGVGKMEPWPAKNALAAAPTTQAAQPAYPELPDFDAVEQHIYAGCRRFIDRDMLEPIHSLIREAVDADRASRGQAPAETAADILERIAEEPPINGNSFATARVLMAAQALRDQPTTTQPVPAQAAPVAQGDAEVLLISAVDEWFAKNTGLGGCSDEDVRELRAIFAAHPAAPVAQGDAWRDLCWQIADALECTPCTADEVLPKVLTIAEEAARYRWLRRWKGQEHEPPFTVQHEMDGTMWGDDLDAAIDAARARAKEGGAA